MILYILLFLYVGANTFELQETCTLTLTHASNEIDCTSNFDTCNNISSCLAYLRTTGSETCTFLCSETTSLCTISNYVLSQGASSIYTKDRTSCEEFKTTSNNNSDSAEIYKLSDWQIIFVWIFLIAISIGLCGGFLLRVTPDEHLPEFLQKEKQRMNLTARLDRRHTVMTLLEEKSQSLKRQHLAALVEDSWSYDYSESSSEGGDGVDEVSIDYCEDFRISYEPGTIVDVNLNDRWLKGVFWNYSPLGRPKVIILDSSEAEEVGFQGWPVVMDINKIKSHLGNSLPN